MQPISVLIADDHQLFREGMESLLKKIPFVAEIHQAVNGKEVLDKLHERHFDIVFMDIRMPEMNGIETTRELSKMKSAARVIALTMLEDSHSIVSMFKAGAYGYLLKNTSFAELQDSINTILKGRKYFAKDISQAMMDRIVDLKTPSPRALSKITLTAREKDVVSFVCRGFSSKDIADLLEISIKTVEKHRSNVYAKLSITNMADLAFYALDEGLVTRSI
ncbi:MAG TPA: response regulator transcription factor [Bacteroidia bacterium]|nr:response regulator transcription factor [Bacteroidia bacterium]